MRHGKVLLVDVGKESPALLFKEFGDDTWPASKVWNHEEWAKDDVHKLVLKEGEHHDQLNSPQFHSNPMFAMAIMVSEREGGKYANELLAMLPNREQFKYLDI